MHWNFGSNYTATNYKLLLVGGYFHASPMNSGAWEVFSFSSTSFGGIGQWVLKDPYILLAIAFALYYSPEMDSIILLLNMLYL